MNKLSPSTLYFPVCKRVFDLILTFLSSPIWFPVVAISALALFLTEGRPVFYASRRRVQFRLTDKIIKFRTMVRNADKIINRDTVKITGTCFLNIPPDSPIYTPIGRIIERCHFTELPQFIHVLSGKMSIIGCRPLPENVIDSLRQHFPQTEDRFISKAGMTGPVQLIGRDEISDKDRLYLEIEYSLVSMFSYSIMLDLAILVMTVWVASGLRGKPFKPSEVSQLMARFSRHNIVSSTFQKNSGRLFFRYVKNKHFIRILFDGVRLEAHLQDISYEGTRLQIGSALSLKPGSQLTLCRGTDELLLSTVLWSKVDNNSTTLGVVFNGTGPRGEKLLAILL